MKCKMIALGVVGLVFVLGRPSLVGKETVVGPEKGTLIIAGGGGNRAAMTEILSTFVEAAGGKDAKIVVVPTAASSSEDYDYANYRMADALRSRFKVKDVTVVHTHDRKEADTEKFVAPIKRATGVWFSGGRQWRFTKAYRGTKAETAFRGVLERGGAIAGSSAGATIQGSFLARGDSGGNTIMIGDFQYGFGYLRNTAIDQHIVPRKRQLDMIKVLEDPDGKMKPEYDREAMLGLGIDEDTAIVVQGDTFEVIGREDGLVFVYDPRKWKDDTDDHAKYITLAIGEKFDLAGREKIRAKGGKSSK